MTRRLYGCSKWVTPHLHRQGIEVEREPRPVEIFELMLKAWEPPELVLDVSCSAGTYVRSLAHDLGQALGCGAHLVALTRLASGAFILKDSVTLEEFERAAARDQWRDFLLPMDAALAHLPAVQLGTDMATRFCQGQAIPIQDAAIDEQSSSTPSDAVQRGGDDKLDGPSSVFRVNGPDGGLLALAKLDHVSGTLRPHKVFYAPGDGKCG